MTCGQYCKTIIDTASLDSIFTERDLNIIIGERKVVIRDMIEGERYIDIKRHPLDLLGFKFVRFEVGE